MCIRDSNYGEGADRKLLIGSGNKGASVLFIGDDPDLYQNEDLKVASGSSGEFLIKLCDIEGILPDEYYITTLAKKDCKFREYMEDDQNELLEMLDMQIALINPKIVVALGLSLIHISSAILQLTLRNFPTRTESIPIPITPTTIITNIGPIHSKSISGVASLRPEKTNIIRTYIKNP